MSARERFEVPSGWHFQWPCGQLGGLTVELATAPNGDLVDLTLYAADGEALDGDDLRVVDLEAAELEAARARYSAEGAGLTVPPLGGDA